MSKYSAGILMIRMIAEMEAQSGRFDAILPAHFWMALTKFAELSENTIAKIVEGDKERTVRLSFEVSRMKRWFADRDLDGTSQRRKLRQRLGRGAGEGGNLHRSPESVELFRRAEEKAFSEEGERVDCIHLAETLCAEPPQELVPLLGQGIPVAKTSVLARFGKDLTQLATAGKLGPVIGRKAELLHLAQVLSRKRKCNGLLVGDAGVGKTCIVEGLAQKIVSPTCPPPFKGKKIIELTPASLISEAKYRCDLEKRLEAILAEVENDPDLILFVDEFHSLIAKKGEGREIANILKPALARGSIRLIGATTTSEYEQYLAQDDAIARRFEVVWIDEPSRRDTIDIINGMKSSFEEYHDIMISEQAINASVDLSIRFLPEKRLPDKAMDLIDQACARRSLACLTMAPRNGNAAETVTVGTLDTVIGRDDVARVLADQVRVPLELLMAEDRQRINILEEYLGKRVIGQVEAINSVRKVLQAAYLGLRDPRRPIASFLFAGPTGVGKTETAKALTDFLFGSQQSLIRIDLSEYMDKHQIARLLGSPPGYVGSEKPGLLTAALRERPASVVLFDEIEKAHPDVLNVLLQILDEGHLADGQGRKAFFREALVILTTNIMPEVNKKKGIGFQAVDEGSVDSSDEKHSRLLEALQRHLRPELLGRIQKIIQFNALDSNSVRLIAGKVLEQLAMRLVGQGVDIPSSLKEQIILQVEGGRFGAREVERFVESRVAAWMHSGQPGNRTMNDDSVMTSEPRQLSVMPKAVEIEAALLVFDLVQSTHVVRNLGDTYFCTHIGEIYKFFKGQDQVNELMFLKCTGDGFLGVYKSASTALATALSFFKSEMLQKNPFRIALHWGRIKTDPNGDPLGKEVHRVFRIEGIRNDALADPPEVVDPLPDSGRILATEEILAQLTDGERSIFQFAGNFSLKGFDRSCGLWLARGKEI